MSEERGHGIIERKLTGIQAEGRRSSENGIESK